MGLELISQVLSPTNATYINGVSAERRFSAAVLKNLYQGLVEKDGLGVNDKFVSEDDANSAAQVFVNRVLPVLAKPREQGANKMVHLSLIINTMSKLKQSVLTF